MTATSVINIKSGAEYDVYIGRRVQYQPKYVDSKWHNPFFMDKPDKKRDGTREEVIEKYRYWILQPEQKYLLDCLPELKGKILGCWCVKKPINFIRKDKVFHGEVLLEVVERYGNN